MKTNALRTGKLLSVFLPFRAVPALGVFLLLIRALALSALRIVQVFGAARGKNAAAVFHVLKLLVHHFIETLFYFFLTFSYKRAHLTAVRRKQSAADRTEQKPDREFLHDL